MAVNVAYQAVTKTTDTTATQSAGNIPAGADVSNITNIWTLPEAPAAYGGNYVGTDEEAAYDTLYGPLFGIKFEDSTAVGHTVHVVPTGVGVAANYQYEQPGVLDGDMRTTNQGEAADWIRTYPESLNAPYSKFLVDHPGVPEGVGPDLSQIAPIGKGNGGNISKFGVTSTPVEGGDTTGTSEPDQGGTGGTFGVVGSVVNGIVDLLGHIFGGNSPAAVETITFGSQAQQAASLETALAASAV